MAVHATRRAGLGLDEIALVNWVGSVGLAVIQVARIAGAKVNAVADTEERAELAKVMGAEEAMVVGDYARLPTRVQEVSPEGVDVYFELAGTPA